MESQRILSIDAAKAVCILGVVAIHCSGSEKSDYISYLLAWFRLGVPLFIIFSFYLIDQRERTLNAWIFLSKRLKRLIIPYLVYSLLYYLIFSWWQRHDILKIITGYFTGFGWSGQYYLLVLMQLTLLYPLVRKLRLNLSRTLGLSGLCLIAIYIPFSYLQISPIVRKMEFVPFVYSVPYMLWGIFVARTKLRLGKARQSGIFLLMFFMALGLIVIEYKLLKLTPLSSYASFSILIASFIISYLVISLEQVGANKPIVQKTDFFKKLSTQIIPSLTKKAILCISRYTLGIYCLNPFWIKILSLATIGWPWLNGDIRFYLTWIGAFGLALLCSYYLSKIEGMAVVVR